MTTENNRFAEALMKRPEESGVNKDAGDLREYLSGNSAGGESPEFLADAAAFYHRDLGLGKEASILGGSVGGAAAGALLGAGSGAIGGAIGAGEGERLRGAMRGAAEGGAIGAGVGAVGGGFIGHHQNKILKVLESHGINPTGLTGAEVAQIFDSGLISPGGVAEAERAVQLIQRESGRTGFAALGAGAGGAGFLAHQRKDLEKEATALHQKVWGAAKETAANPFISVPVGMAIGATGARAVDKKRNSPEFKAEIRKSLEGGRAGLVQVRDRKMEQAQKGGLRGRLAASSVKSLNKDIAQFDAELAKKAGVLENIKDLRTSKTNISDALAGDREAYERKKARLLPSSVRAKMRRDEEICNQVAQQERTPEAGPFHQGQLQSILAKTARALPYVPFDKAAAGDYEKGLKSEREQLQAAYLSNQPTRRTRELSAAMGAPSGAALGTLAGFSASKGSLRGSMLGASAGALSGLGAGYSVDPVHMGQQVRRRVSIRNLDKELKAIEEARREKKAKLMRVPVTNESTGETKKRWLRVRTGGSLTPEGERLIAKMKASGTFPGKAEKNAGMSFTEQDRPEKVKDIYRALKRDHPNMPAEMKARIAARQGKPGKQHQGPPYKGPLTKTSSELSTKERNALGEGAFALPGRRYPIHDKAHARNALARVSQHGTASEKAQVTSAVHSRFPDIGKEAEAATEQSGYRVNWRKALPTAGVALGVAHAARGGKRWDPHWVTEAIPAGTKRYRAAQLAMGGASGGGIASIPIMVQNPFEKKPAEKTAADFKKILQHSVLPAAMGTLGGVSTYHTAKGLDGNLASEDDFGQMQGFQKLKEQAKREAAENPGGAAIIGALAAIPPTVLTQRLGFRALERF